MPTSLSAGSCCTHYQTASTASVTTASSPMAPAAITSPVVVGCSMPVTLVPASLPTITRKAIDHSPQPTSPSVAIAAAPCGGPLPCRAPATLRRSLVTPHDRPADAYRNRARSQRCGQQCPHRHRAADQPLPSAMSPIPALEIDAITAITSRTPAACANKSPATRRC